MKELFLVHTFPLVYTMVTGGIVFVLKTSEKGVLQWV